MKQKTDKILRIPELDALRGIFMFMIFLFHMHLFSGGGKLGVTFFFILSGFSMTLGYRDRALSGDFSYKGFLFKRMAKLLPIHWLTLAMAFVLKSIEIIVSGFDLTIIPKFVTNLLLVQAWIPIPDYFLSFNSVSWYLSDTLFFIALFPLLIRYIINTTKSIQTIVAVVIFILYVGVVLKAPHMLYVFPLVRLLDFVIGIYIAKVLLDKLPSISQAFRNSVNGNKNWILIGSFFLLIFLIIESVLLENELSFVAVLYWPAIIAIILGTTLVNICSWGGYNILQNNVLQWLGNISFPFYMIHQLIYRYCYTFFHYILHTDNIWILAPIVLLISILAAYFLNVVFVKPVSAYLIQKRNF